MGARVENLLLPFGRAERARNRGRRLGRKKSAPRVAHRRRQAFAKRSAVHVTLGFSRHVPNLRARRRFAAVRDAFVKFSLVTLGDAGCFRLVHFNVLGNHVHLIVEADTDQALSVGMRKLAHSISRRLNAQSARAAGTSLDPRDKLPLREQPGWLGRVFSDRYHAHLLRSAREIEHAVAYVLENGARHFGRPISADGFSSAFERAAVVDGELFLLRRAFGRWRAATCAHLRSQPAPAE